MVFSENVTELDKQCFRGLCGIKVVKEHAEYLGLPTSFGRKKKARFSRIVERVSVNTKGWKEKNLSVVGKEILIKAVAQAIPNYAMSCFLLPKSVCDDIERIIRDFWWGDTQEKRKLHWISWDQLKVDKMEGGMGFKDLRSFNIAMLAKQAWRLLTQPETLLGRIFKDKYYKNSTILEAKITDRVSFAFRGILAGRNLLQEGLFWRLGNGRDIHPFMDRWLPRPTSYRPITPPPELDNLRVADFITDGCWDREKVQARFWSIDVDFILGIPVANERSDEQTWLFSQSGSYSVSSGYRLHRSSASSQPESSTGMNRGWLKMLWNLKIPRKVSVTTWRVWKESLPVATRVRRRGIHVPVACSFRNNSEESEDHLFRLCPVSVAVWDRVLPSSGRRTDVSSIREWIEHCFLKEDLRFCQLFAISMWTLWFHTNCARFKGENLTIEDLVAAINRHVVLFGLALSTEMQPEGVSTSVRRLEWEKPEEGWVKVNCDASVHPSRGLAGTGVVFRDEQGTFVAGKSSRQPFNPSVLLIELIAIREGMILAKEAGCKKVAVESDCATAIELLSNNLDFPSTAYSGEIVDLLEFCRGFSPWFEVLTFAYVSREVNTLAHAFARHGLDSDSPILFTEKPSWATEALYSFPEPVGV